MRSEKGFSLIEVAIGIAVLSILAVTFLLAVQNSAAISHQANVRTTAEKLAVSQMETIKSGSYIIAQDYQADYTSTMTALPTGFRIKTLDKYSNSVADYIYGVPWDITNSVLWSETAPLDPGIQKITIIVESNSEFNSDGVYTEIFRLTDFKVNR